MPRKEEVEGYRRGYQKKTDDELIHELHRWVPHCAQHIAAKQEIEARKRESDKMSFLEAMKVAKRANILAAVAILIAALSMLLWSLNVAGLLGIR
jgi:K+-sensing histidine kinase KdpD